MTPILVGQDDGLVDVVRDEEHGLARRPPDLDQLALHGGAGVGVERGERFVHQQHLRLVGEHARDLDALLHAAGQLGRMLVILAPQPDEVEIAVRPLEPLGARQPAHAQSELDVAERRQPRIERVVALEHHAAVRAGALDGLAGDLDFTGRSRLEPGQHVEHRGLAAAARAQQAEELAGLDVQVEIAHGHVVAALHRAKNLADARESNQRQGVSLQSPASPRPIGGRSSLHCA